MHEIWELFWEVLEHNWKKFYHGRMKKPWKQNLFFIPLLIALIVIMILLFQMYIYPGRL